MRTKEELIEFYNSLYDNGLFWYILGSLISSDSFVFSDKDELKLKYDQHITKLEELLKILPETKIPAKEEVSDMIQSGIQTLLTEYKNLGYALLGG